jgi:hypothetical protein
MVQIARLVNKFVIANSSLNDWFFRTWQRLIRERADSLRTRVGKLLAPVNHALGYDSP